MLVIDGLALSYISPLSKKKQPKENKLKKSKCETTKSFLAYLCCRKRKTMTNLELKFLTVASKAPSICVCRCNPLQKAQVVRLIKSSSKKITAAIGDGGNDIAMIKEASVGVGIVGREGKQASLAADYSINQFDVIKRLFFVHGRNSYVRTSLIAHIIF